MQDVKDFLALVATTIVATLSPALYIVVAAVGFGFADFIFGVWASESIQKEKYSGTKAFKAVIRLAIVSSIILSVVITGRLLGFPIEARIEGARAVCLGYIYFSSLNINKNLIRIYPEEPFFEWLDSVLKVSVIRYIPMGRRRKNDK